MRYGKKIRICTDGNRVGYEHESARNSDSRTSNVKQSALTKWVPERPLRVARQFYRRVEVATHSRAGRHD